MTPALLLALALTGQSCPGGSCAVRTAVVTVPHSSWENYAVRVKVNNGRSTSYGSGTIVSSEGNRKLVLTARHVLGRAQTGISVRHLGMDYRARWLAIASDGDLGALEADIPGYMQHLGIAADTPSRAVMLGYGESGQLHQHSGSYVGGGSDSEYSFAAENGDSGGGVFSPEGHLSGVIWGTTGSTSMVVSTEKVKRFLNCQYSTTPGSSGTKVCWAFPFFFSKRTWNNGGGSVIVQPPVTPVVPGPIQPPIVQPPVIAGPAGPQGPLGPQGPAGPAGVVPDLSGLIGDVASLKTQMASVTTQLAQTAAILNGLVPTVGQIKSAVQRPIVVNGVGPDGSVTSAPVQLGDTLDVGLKSISDRLSALEAKSNTPPPPTPAK